MPETIEVSYKGSHALVVECPTCGTETSAPCAHDKVQKTTRFRDCNECGVWRDHDIVRAAERGEFDGDLICDDCDQKFGGTINLDLHDCPCDGDDDEDGDDGGDGDDAHECDHDDCEYTTDSAHGVAVHKGLVHDTDAESDDGELIADGGEEPTRDDEGAADAVNSLIRRGLSPGQAWHYYGVVLLGNSRNSWAKQCDYGDHSAVSESVRKAKAKLGESESDIIDILRALDGQGRVPVEDLGHHDDPRLYIDTPEGVIRTKRRPDSVTREGSSTIRRWRWFKYTLEEERDGSPEVKHPHAIVVKNDG